MQAEATIHDILSALWLFVTTPSTWDASAKIALLTAVGTITWSLVQNLLRFVRYHLSSRLLSHDIEFSALVAAIQDHPAAKGLPYRLVGLLIRFGSDAYIERLASDQERYEGRLQNSLLTLRKGAVLELPVHTRLGTQFKMFLDCDSEADAAVFATIPFLTDRNVGIDGRKVWFLLKAFGTTPSVDGFENNFVLPTRLDEFVERAGSRNLAATTTIKRTWSRLRTHIRRARRR